MSLFNLEIQNFEALSTPVNRGRNFGSARVTRSASPVKWRRKSAPASSFDSEDSVPTIPVKKFSKIIKNKEFQ